MNRRDVLRTLAVSAGAGAARGLLPPELLRIGRLVHDRTASGARLTVLSARAVAAVTAAAERIIPAGDAPGATDAAVSRFIDRMLADWYTAEERERFLAGIEALNATSRSRHGRDFADSTAVDQDALLLDLDGEVSALRSARRGVAGPAVSNPDDHWFAMLKWLTVWGYCTSEVAMRQALRAYPLPGRFEPCAPLAVPAPAGSPS